MYRWDGKRSGSMARSEHTIKAAVIVSAGNSWEPNPEETQKQLIKTVFFCLIDPSNSVHYLSCRQFVSGLPLGERCPFLLYIPFGVDAVKISLCVLH